MENKYPISLSDAWTVACVKLWNLCKKYDRDTDKLTIWDGFKLLYLENVPKEEKGRRASGVHKPFVSWKERTRKKRKKNDTN